MDHIIVEGPDRSGKSTLIKMLQDEIPELAAWQNKHHGPYPNGVVAFDHYYEDLGKKKMIFDRMFLSEQIYSRVLHRPYMGIDLNDVLSMRLKGPVIFCIPHKREVLDNWTEDEFVTYEQLDQIYDYFELLSTQSFSYPTFVYDFRNPETFDILAQSLLVRLQSW